MALKRQRDIYHAIRQAIPVMAGLGRESSKQ